MKYSINIELQGEEKELRDFEKSVKKILNVKKDRSKIKTHLNTQDKIIRIKAEATDLPALKATYNAIMQMLILYEKIKNIERG